MGNSKVKEKTSEVQKDIRHWNCISHFPTSHHTQTANCTVAFTPYNSNSFQNLYLIS